MTSALLLIGLVVLLIVGVSAAFALGVSGFGYFAFTRGVDSIPYEIITQRMVGTVDSFTLLAIPLFLFVGHMMNESGATTRVFRFANVLVGHWRGGLAQVNVLASMMFAGMSGSGTADAAGLGAIELKAMREAGYDDETSIGVTVGSALIGPIIPPSIAAILYAVLAEVSPADVLLAGAVPGILMALALMLLVAMLARRRSLPSTPFPGMGELWRSFVRAIWSLLTPFILIGGIIAGVFTATESGAVAALWATVVAMAVHRSVDLKGLFRVLRRSAYDSAIIMFILACSGLFAWILTRARVPQTVADGIMGMTADPTLIMVLIAAFLIVVGCFMAVAVSINILTPILVPIAVSIGMDPVHFGIVMIMILVIGEATPPFGMVLFVMTRIAGVPFDRVVRASVPFLLAILAVILLVAVFPSLALWLPRLVGG